MPPVSLELSGISKTLSRRTGAQPRRLRMPPRRDPCRPWREWLWQEHASRHRRRRGGRRRRPNRDHGPAARRRRSAAGAPTRLGRCLPRRTRWCANSPSRRIFSSGQRMVLRRLGGKRQWAAKQLAPYDLGISPDALVGQLSAFAAAVPRNRQSIGGESEGPAARRADLEPRHFRCRKAERHHPPDRRSRRCRRLCEPPIAGNPGACQPRNHSPRRRGPRHLRRQRAGCRKTI